MMQCLNFELLEDSECYIGKLLKYEKRYNCFLRCDAIWRILCIFNSLSCIIDCLWIVCQRHVSSYIAGDGKVVSYDSPCCAIGTHLWHGRPWSRRVDFGATQRSFRTKTDFDMGIGGVLYRCFWQCMVEKHLCLSLVEACSGVGCFRRLFSCTYYSGRFV